MLRYKTETRPGLVALYDIRPGNGAGLFLQPQSPHGASERQRHRHTGRQTDREREKLTDRRTDLVQSGYVERDAVTRWFDRQSLHIYTHTQTMCLK